MPIICLITAVKCGEIHMRTRYNRYMLQKKKLCKHEGYLPQARHIISYFKTVCVYDMIDLNSMVFMF